MDYFSLFKNLPPQAAVLLTAMIPIAELRVSIPMAIGAYKMSVASAFFWSVLGNSIPTVFILYLIDPVANFLSKNFKIFEKFFQWIFARTRRNFSVDYEKWGALALIIFVAIPLPMTGAWSGALAAWLFGIPKKRAIIYVTLGVIGAGIIVTLLTLGVISVF